MTTTPVTETVPAHLRGALQAIQGPWLTYIGTRMYRTIIERPDGTSQLLTESRMYGPCESTLTYMREHASHLLRPGERFVLETTQHYDHDAPWVEMDA